MPEQHSYPDLTAPADMLSLVKDLRKRRKSISEADLDALEKAVLAAAVPAASEVMSGHAPDAAAVKAAYVAAARAVPVTADLFTAAGQGQASMQARIVEALGKL